MKLYVAKADVHIEDIFERLVLVGFAQRGCQMAYLPTKIPNFGLFLEGLGMENVGKFNGNLVHFTANFYRELHVRMEYYVADW
jgi:hypothetical protein